jgi:hypothetical protein
MNKKLPSNDPIAACTRKAIAARRVGVGKQCACGEKRPEALIAGTTPIVCASCKRKREGKTIMDKHHVFGRANDPTTIQVPVNDHRAELSVAQHDWPKNTLQNPDGSPLLRAAACIRGFVDTVLYLIQKGLRWVADMLESLDALLVKEWGSRWWVGTGIEQIRPGGHTSAKS